MVGGVDVFVLIFPGVVGCLSVVVYHYLVAVLIGYFSVALKLTVAFGR